MMRFENFLGCIAFLSVGIQFASGDGDCWWSGCQPKSWAERGCYPQSDYDQTESKPCDNGNGDMYRCCPKGSSGGGDGGGSGAPVGELIEFSY
jgi:hypothetical protein